jgi:short-subunit dehydrogenase
MNVENKVVIITGASAGIGYATARLLAKNGAKTALVSRSKRKLERLAQELPDSLAVPADMTKPEEIKQMVKVTEDYFGRIDVLINCAGQGYMMHLLKQPTLAYFGTFSIWTLSGRSLLCSRQSLS